MKDKCLWKAKKSSFGLSSLSLPFPLPLSRPGPIYTALPVFTSLLTCRLLFLSLCLHVSASHFQFSGRIPTSGD